MRRIIKYSVIGFLALAILLSVWVASLRTVAPPPLPFDATVFTSTHPPTSSFHPANLTFGERIRYFIFRALQKLQGQGGSTWTFSASPRMSCSIQGLLNQCMQVSSNTYLMPLGVATGSVQFGNTNSLNGPQWVAAFEDALQHGTVHCLDSETHRMREEHLVLLRFQPQKTILVLPESQVAQFIRTNQIHLLDVKKE